MSMMITRLKKRTSDVLESLPAQPAAISTSVLAANAVVPPLPRATKRRISPAPAVLHLAGGVAVPTEPVAPVAIPSAVLAATAPVIQPLPPARRRAPSPAVALPPAPLVTSSATLSFPASQPAYPLRCFHTENYSLPVEHSEGEVSIGGNFGSEATIWNGELQGTERTSLETSGPDGYAAIWESYRRQTGKEQIFFS